MQLTSQPSFWIWNPLAPASFPVASWVTSEGSGISALDTAFPMKVFARVIKQEPTGRAPSEGT